MQMQLINNKLEKQYQNISLWLDGLDVTWFLSKNCWAQIS